MVLAGVRLPCAEHTKTLSVMIYKGKQYKLNQLQYAGDLYEWGRASAVGEYTIYYDAYVFHTADGLWSASRSDITNTWKI